MNVVPFDGQQNWKLILLREWKFKKKICSGHLNNETTFHLQNTEHLNETNQSKCLSEIVEVNKKQPSNWFSSVRWWALSWKLAAPHVWISYRSRFVWSPERACLFAMLRCVCVGCVIYLHMSALSDFKINDFKMVSTNEKKAAKRRERPSSIVVMIIYKTQFEITFDDGSSFRSECVCVFRLFDCWLFRCRMRDIFSISLFRFFFFTFFYSTLYTTTHITYVRSTPSPFRYNKHTKNCVFSTNLSFDDVSVYLFRYTYIYLYINRFIQCFCCFHSTFLNDHCPYSANHKMCTGAVWMDCIYMYIINALFLLLHCSAL